MQENLRGLVPMHWKLSKLVLWPKGTTILIHLKYLLFSVQSKFGFAVSICWQGKTVEECPDTKLPNIATLNSLYNLLLHLHFFVLVYKVLHNESAKLEEKVCQTISCLVPYKVIQLMTGGFIGQSMLPNCLIKKLLSKSRESNIDREKEKH